MSKENTTVETTSRGLPVLFLAGAVIAYFNMPEHAETIEKIVGSIGVGVGTSVGLPVGMIGGAGLGAIFGAVASPKDRELGVTLGAIAGLIFGAPTGIYMGYQLAKDYVDDHIRSNHKTEIHRYETGYSKFKPFENQTITTKSGQNLQLSFG